MNLEMADYFKPLSRFFAVMAILFLAIGFMGAWSFGFSALSAFVGLPLLALVLIAGSILYFVRGMKVARQSADSTKRLITLVAAPALFAAMALLALPFVRTGNYLGDFSLLMVNWDRYEAIVADIRANPRAAAFEVDGDITYSVDLGPPVRVAFNPEGLLDNWSGIIYDPTGDVLLADGFDPKTGKFVAPNRVTKLFQGDLVRCRSLWGDYYTCSFT